MKIGGDLLPLDGPTNDLDVETLRALEDALTDYAGCAVIILRVMSVSPAACDRGVRCVSSVRA